MLSLKLGIPYRQLLNTLTHEEILTYLAYNEIEPFAEFREDERFAMLAMVQHNSHVTDRKYLAKMQDFMLRSKPKKPQKMAPEEMLAQMKILAAQMGKK